MGRTGAGTRSRWELGPGKHLEHEDTSALSCGTSFMVPRKRMSSQRKSARTLVGEPNVKAETGKKNTKNVQSTRVAWKTWKQYLHETKIEEPRTSRQSLRRSFPAAPSQLLNNFAPAKHLEFNAPNFLWASTERICFQRWAGKFAMQEAKIHYWVTHL